MVRRVLAGIVVAVMGTSPAWAATIEELEAKVEAQARMIEELRQDLAALKAAQGGRVAAESRGEIPSLPERAQALARQEPKPGWGGVYSKPFLRRFGRNVYVGGYADLEFKDSESGNAFFDQHRLIPFIYADVSERVKFATEIEFEHGGTNNNAGDGEVKVEFATIDYLLADPVNFRGGILLSPVGKLNLVHDSPLQDLTERPLVDQFVIPTTLSEAGMGFFGSFYPTELAKLDYELYATNGFRGLTGKAAGDVKISRTRGLRDARGGQKSDINDEPAMMGRLAFSPFLGVELGASGHLGTYDTDGENLLGLYALDGAWQYGSFELLAEGAYAAIERNGLAKSLGVPDDVYGYYVQGNYHFLPSFLRNVAPRIFTDEATFTVVNRWDQVNLDGNRTKRYTVGLNFRPTEDTVFKTDFQFNQESGLLDSQDDNAVLFSVATYF